MDNYIIRDLQVSKVTSLQYLEWIMSNPDNDRLIDRTDLPNDVIVNEAAGLGAMNPGRLTWTQFPRRVRWAGDTLAAMTSSKRP